MKYVLIQKYIEVQTLQKWQIENIISDANLSYELNYTVSYIFNHQV